jgi:hypothetical protein
MEAQPVAQSIQRDLLDASTLRRAADQEWFPYKSPKVPFILIAGGQITQAKGIGDKRAACATAAADPEAVLLAAWPGEWSQDIFLLDPVKALEEIS